MPVPIADNVREGQKRQVVGQAELLPCLLARRLWAERLRGRLVVHFVDNEAARFALIKGTPPTVDSAWIAGEMWGAGVGCECFSWFGRVPSPSNPADGPGATPTSGQVSV